MSAITYMNDTPKATCFICGWTAEEVTRDLARCLATWHVYERHLETWRCLVGRRSPVDPDPRTARGRRKILAKAS